MGFDDHLDAVRRNGGADAEQVGELARAALAEQREEDALPLLRIALTRSSDARLWQWKALLERALEDYGEALKSFAEAAVLAPDDASIAHGRARAALEAGLPAIAWFVRALELAPDDPQVYLGLNAARLAEGKSDEAETELDQILGQNPLWFAGHQQLAQVRSLRGRRDHAFDSLERAIASQPAAIALWQALCELQVLGEDYALVRRTVERAGASGIPPQALGDYAFIAASETGETAFADSLLTGGAAAIPPVWIVRHALRSGRIGQASALIDRALEGPAAADLWPYAATVWRATGDPRFEWLTGDPNLVKVIDLHEALESIPGLTKLLRSLHQASGRYLNQSVRGGSQTDGPLFSRLEPEIRALRALMVEAIEGYRAGLSSLPETHPQKKPSGRVRFSGSWSVRLVDGGFHTNHVHPLGWVSSALYISLPERLDEHEGWLTLGEPPPELELDVRPTRLIEPRPGQLVLFPSWMFHGTRPFARGERLTVAFDVIPPPTADQSSSSS
jgi:tetratricopeptide (TPR) repeat protein